MTEPTLPKSDSVISQLSYSMDTLSPAIGDCLGEGVHRIEERLWFVSDSPSLSFEFSLLSIVVLNLFNGGHELSYQASSKDRHKVPKVTLLTYIGGLHEDKLLRTSKFGKCEQGLGKGSESVADYRSLSLSSTQVPVMRGCPQIKRSEYGFLQAWKPEDGGGRLTE